jgi:hypothetical protein
MDQHDAVHSGSVPFSHEGRQVAYWDWNAKLLHSFYLEVLPKFITDIRDLYKVTLMLSTNPLLNAALRGSSVWLIRV